MTEILKVENLSTHFETEAGLVKAVDDTSFHIGEKEIVSIVGESGCGKSVSLLSVLQLVKAPGKIVGGKILFEGKDLLQYKTNSREMRSVRGARISIIFQEPMTSLNPVLTIGQQLGEMLQLHQGMTEKDARKRTIELLSMVGIPGAADRLDDHPHQFSGGMCQRVMIAMAISCSPKILIADEPTTALDVTTQAQLLKLMKDMVQKLETSLVLVTHNLGLVARYAQRIYVMYAGCIVESGTTREIFSNPRHPYTVGLLKSIPRLDAIERKKLVPIEGLPPNLINMPPACAFLPRCSRRIDVCYQKPRPPLFQADGQHYYRCYLKEELQ
ncbi:ABC transporter ATP-binding protein [Thermodesulfobacteriota bacterium]